MRSLRELNEYGGMKPRTQVKLPGGLDLSKESKTHLFGVDIRKRKWWGLLSYSTSGE